MLSVSRLTSEFITSGRSHIAVNGISFSVNRGETLAIVGESGSGKSTTALSILRLLPKNAISTADRVAFHSTNLMDLNPEEIRKIRGNKIAMIFQEPASSLNPVFTCGEQIAEVVREHKKLNAADAKAQSMELLKKVQLQNTERIYNSFPHQLSGGQKQRIMIAIAISCNPDLLIADEPTSSLDDATQTEIIALLKNIQRDLNMGMIFISHDLSLVSQIADHVAVMYKGKIVEYGTKETIFQNPVHPYTKALLACREGLSNKLYRLPTVNDFMKENADGSIVEIITPKQIRPTTADYTIDQPILTLKNIQVTYAFRQSLFSKQSSTITAVNNFNLEIGRGESIGLVGSSGSGKSSLAKAIVRLIDTASGEIIVESQNFSSAKGKELRMLRKKIQLIFQDPFSSLNPTMKIGEAIMEPMLAHNLHGTANGRKEKAVSLLEQVGLQAQHFSRYPQEFSGGQRQRIVIARALACEPDILICDEIVSALDVSVQAQILNLLQDLKQQKNLTYLFISHDKAVIDYMCDRILVMEKGFVRELTEKI